MPALLMEEEAGPTTFVVQSNGLLSSLAICLEQEMLKFNRFVCLHFNYLIGMSLTVVVGVNRLLRQLTTSMSDLRKAIRGLIVMSSDLDAMYTSFLNNAVPGLWEKVSFASLKTLGSWVTDLRYRVQFMRRWLTKGQPAAFPLPVFFFPQVLYQCSWQYEYY